MIIAKQKRKTNIAEYILYMWQIEDLLRAYKFNSENIRNELVNQYDVDTSEKQEIQDWYDGLMTSMVNEEITQRGHLQFLVSLVDDINDFHFRLIDSPNQSDYQKEYMKAIYNIGDFRKKMGSKEKISDIEVSLTVLYGLMLMRLKNKNIEKDTIDAIDSIKNLVTLLASKFREFEEGQLEL